LIRELSSFDYYLFQVKNSYHNDSNYQLNANSSLVQFSKNSTFFNPQDEKEHENFLNLMKEFLDFKQLKTEIAFYKGSNIHSCSRQVFDLNSNNEYLAICSLKERNANYTFEVGVLNSSPYLYKNKSEYDSIYIFNTKQEIFENFNVNCGKDTCNFSSNQNENKFLKEFYYFMKNNKLVPEYTYIDGNDNNTSEGGFNLVVRRSLLAIILTGVISSAIYIGVFIVAKMYKKSNFDKYEPIE